MYEKYRTLMSMGQPVITNVNTAPSLPYTHGGFGLQRGQFAVGASGPHPGVETGYMPAGTMNEPPVWNDATNSYDINIGMGGAPDMRSPWKKFGDAIDKEFVAAALSSLGSGRRGRSARGGGGGGGGRGGGGGGGIKAPDGLSPILPEIPAQAPNPGFYTLLPKEQKDRYSGGF